jgi:hypothetical protein
VSQTCPHCATVLPATAEFCTGCLADLTPPEEPNESDQSRSTLEKAALFGEGARLLIVGPALLGLTGFCLYRLVVATGGGAVTEAVMGALGAILFGGLLYILVKWFVGAARGR